MGDFNAKVANSKGAEDKKLIKEYIIRGKSQKGEHLAESAIENHFVISNKIYQNTHIGYTPGQAQMA